MDKKKLQWLMLLLIAVVLWARACPPAKPEVTGVELIGRPWLERMPRTPRDTINHLMFIERDGEHVTSLHAVTGRSLPLSVDADAPLGNKRRSVGPGPDHPGVPQPLVETLPFQISLCVCSRVDP